MKTRLLGFVFAIGLMLIPTLASASIMDGTYVGSGILVTDFGTTYLNNYTAVIGADPQDVEVDYTHAYLPSADLLPFGNLAADGFAVYQTTDPTVVAFESSLAEFTGSGTLSFFNTNSDPLYEYAMLDASGFSSLFGFVEAQATLYNQAATPIPAAIWFLGTGLVGLAGLRGKFRKA